MAFQQKPNSGALFKNDKKESDKHPDYKGDINIEGRNYWISAWVKEGKSGKFFSISVSEKKAPGVSKQVDKPDTSHRRAEPVVPDDFPDDSIPF
jgi:hypothetical protein